MLEQAYRSGHQGRPGWKVKFDYDMDTIAALKALVPATDRTWNEEHKYWWVAQEYEDVLLKLFPSFEAHLHQTSMF